MRGVLAAALLLTAAPAWAAPDASLDRRIALGRELLEVTRSTETARQAARNSFLVAFDQGVRNQPGGADLLANNAEMFDSIRVAAMDELDKVLIEIMPGVNSEVAAFYASKLAEPQLAEMVAFFKGATGQTFLDLTPETMIVAIATTQKAMAPLQARITARAEKAATDYIAAHPEKK